MSISSAGNDGVRSSGGSNRVTAVIAAEAAVWITSLHGPDRDKAMEDRFRAWLKLSPAHREAFEKTTDVWQAVAGTQTAKAYMQAASERARRDAKRVRRSTFLWGGLLALVILAVGASSALLAA